MTYSNEVSRDIYLEVIKFYICIYTPVFKNVANSKHVYHIYSYTFSAPVSYFLSAPGKTYMHIEKKLQVMVTPGEWGNVCPHCLSPSSVFTHI